MTEITLTYIPRDESDPRGEEHRDILVDGRVEIKHDHIWINAPEGMELLAWYEWGGRVWKTPADYDEVATELWTDITIVSMS